jgi:transcriptional regulator with XRE-family HTH domain
MSEDFQGFIARLTKQHGTARALAEAIDMSESAFSRGVRLEGTLSIENCLRLAKWAGEDPSYVLRLAGKETIAILIEELYGKTRTPLSQVDRELVALSLTVKETMMQLVRAATPEEHKRRRA